MKKNSGKTWVKTRTPLLWRHEPSGVFYARVKVAGKNNWKSLDTDILSVARIRLPDAVRRIRGTSNRGGAGTDIPRPRAPFQAACSMRFQAGLRQIRPSGEAFKTVAHY